ncbi:transcription factor bHLH128-like isoform X2 [Benincasa hispida]|uniref:transcription factor bHLH128-like isoform X2 n=1 Tax=Benincasa hispida TaxID=102211 RepID=UPI0019005DB5|nr:transcription factor bHLH128-like isoform X2 [Benincasa hispida]
MYQSTSSSSSSQKSMPSAHAGAGLGGGGSGGGGGLTRYGSAPGSLLTTAVDSVIGSRQPDSAATLRGPPSFGGHYFSSVDSSVVESSRKVVQSSSTSNDLKSSSSTTAAAAAAAALNRSYGFNDLALGDFSTGRNFNSNGGQSSSSSPLVRQRSSPAGFLGHLSVAEPNGGFSLTMGGGGNGIGRLKSQMSFNGQDNSLSQISEMSESFVEAANSCSNGLQSNTNSTHSFGPSAFAMDSSWETSNNSIVFGAPHAKRSKHHSDADFFTSLESQFSLPQTTLEMAAVERLLQIPEDSVPCKIRAKRGCATHPRSIAERERRTRISGKLKKLQELVPNMDKQTSYSDMLDLAVQHIKGLQNQIQKLNKEVENCTCGSKECL